MARSTSTQATRSANGKSTAKSTSAKSATKTAKTPEQIAHDLRNLVFKNFDKTKIPVREQATATKAWYGARSVLGNIASGEFSSQHRGTNEKFDWKKWNQLFESVFGKVEAPKYDPDTIAEILSMLTPSIDSVQDLIRINDEELVRMRDGRRNGGNKSSDLDLDPDLDDDLDEDLDIEDFEEDEDEGEELDEDEFDE